MLLRLKLNSTIVCAVVRALRVRGPMQQVRVRGSGFGALVTVQTRPFYMLLKHRVVNKNRYNTNFLYIHMYFKKVVCSYSRFTANLFLYMPHTIKGEH